MTEKTAIDQERAELLTSFYGVSKSEDILRKFRGDYKAIKNIEGTKAESLTLAIGLYQRYMLAIVYRYKISTIKNNIKKFKRIIEEEKGEIEDYALHAFHIGGFKKDKTPIGGGERIPSIHVVVSATTSEKILQRIKEEQKLTVDVSSEIESIKNLLKNHSYDVKPNQTEEQVRSYHLAYVLGLSTGRRFTEIFKTASIHGTKGEYFFKGILKKDPNQKKEFEAHFIGLKVSEVRKYMRELRIYLDKKLHETRGKGLKETSIGEINAIFAKVYNGATFRISKERIPNFHELRKHYTINGTTLFKIEGESDKDTRYRILGHHEKIDTTLPYSVSK